MNAFFSQLFNETGPVYEPAPIEQSPPAPAPSPEEEAEAIASNITFDEPLQGMQVGPSFMDSVGPEPITTEGAMGFDENFVSAMKEVENGGKAGYDNGVWKPHASLEGGNDTLGYGHKITAAEQKSGKIKIGSAEVDITDGLSDVQIEQLLQQDMSDAEDKLRKSVKGYDDMPPKYKNILVNLVFNTGKVTERGWPKMLKGMRAGDDMKVRQEMVSGYTDKNGKKHKLTNRADKIADSQGLGMVAEGIAPPTTGVMASI